MIELLNIIFSSLIMFLLFNSSQVLLLYKENQNILKNININFIIFFNISLFFSFVDNGIKYFTYLIFLICFLNSIFFFKNLKNYFYILFIIINFVLFLKISSDPSLAWDGIGNWYQSLQLFWAFLFLT